MNVLWIFAHPEPRSLNGALRDEGLHTLKDLGHDVCESDLYAMDWNPVVTGRDYGHDPGPSTGADGDPGRLLVGPASAAAHAAGTLPEEIRAEQAKVTWADALVVQFPLWWFGVPAILKGWFDRVFVKGFAFGVTAPDGRTPRYGDGPLAGKRALAVTTIGARPQSIGPRGVNGPTDEVLWPLLHGVFWYTGMDALPPLEIPSADRLTDDDYRHHAQRLRRRLHDLPHTPPIAYRHQDGGDYDQNLVLHPHIAPGRTGIAAHTR
ncbi:NAD(P)H-dependent oxidoreductase [Actinomadura hibisca]|uniref:NAD(P)H-dependent oxidoreductase n=1 Tax=Actinomadura hibisca TaxID=68565 RepID=UPI00082A3D92|nr:NAD(P)H-dependent oxidoreductase [Actinomadura hibisca]